MAAQQLDGGASAAGDRARRATSRSRFDEFEWGFVYRRVREDSTEQDDALDRRPRVPLAELPLHRQSFEWRVPIDDEHTLHVAWFNDPRARRRAVRAGARSRTGSADHATR